MVFLTSLDILDTGFLAVDREAIGDRSNQVSSADRVNLGVALRLKGVNFDITSSSNLDKTSTPAKLTTNRHGLVSINPDVVTITIMLNQKADSTGSPWGTNDMSYLGALNKLPKTLGFKAVYYPVTYNATGDTRRRDRQIITAIGDRDTTQGQGDISIPLWNGSAETSAQNLSNVKYIAVRFDSCKITQTPSNKIEVQLQGVVTD